MMSVNLSARQFGQPDLVEQVDAILAETASTLDARARDHRSVVRDQSEVGIRTLSGCATWASARSR